MKSKRNRIFKYRRREPICFLARILGTSVKSLRDLGAKRDNRSWMFPERDATGEIVGWLVRDDEGKKKSKSGTKRGLTYATPMHAYAGTSTEQPILVVEGQTDTAVGMDMGFVTVGRPAATGGLVFLKMLLAGCHVVVVGENDDPGRLGAEMISKGLLEIAASVRVVYPPKGLKDLRSWYLDGCDHAELEEAIRAMVPISGAGSVDDQTGSSKKGNSKHTKQADRLIELSRGAEVFRSSPNDGEPCATIEVEDHFETLPIQSRGWRRWLSHEYYRRYGESPRAQALNDATGVIVGEALFSSPVIPIAVRVGAVDGTDGVDGIGPAVYVDLRGSRLARGGSRRQRLARKGA